MSNEEQEWLASLLDRVSDLEKEVTELKTTLAYERDKARDDAAKGLMDCKGYDLYPDGTMRPAHGLGEWVKAEDYDKLHATATTAQAEITALRDAESVAWEYWREVEGEMLVLKDQLTCALLQARENANECKLRMEDLEAKLKEKNGG